MTGEIPEKPEDAEELPNCSTEKKSTDGDQHNDHQEEKLPDNHQDYNPDESRGNEKRMEDPAPTGSGTVKSKYDVQSLEEARSLIASLRERNLKNSHRMIIWRETLHLQEMEIARLKQERNQQLSSLYSQLILFESKLCEKQKQIQESFFERESLILRQRELIARMQNTNSAESGPVPGSSSDDTMDKLDGWRDNDSAVVLEENIYELLPTRFRSNLTDVTVIRSVSDAVEPSRKYALMRRCNGSRKPEVLETVYSVEEDEPEEYQNAPPAELIEKAPDCDTLRKQYKAQGGKRRLQDINSSIECLVSEPESPPTDRSSEEIDTQVTYNRVMGNNHRSVTKVKDVKYKRINKARSKSLEELRGRLRNWVDNGNKIHLSCDNSYA